ncbi:MAG: UbiA family prenyltransferase [Planctomycetes bacterium]|nr:UbiA family prenyltransferase [Planctomycetota bacterium]
MAYWRLVRLPLVFTAVADSAAGYLLAVKSWQAIEPVTLGLLAATSACLYACGMVFNDVADFLRDKVLHPDRPLPSRQVSMFAARRFGLILMFVAALFGCLVNFTVGQAVLLIFILMMVYDFAVKSSGVAGASTMGAIRALNLTLGMLGAVPRSAGLLVVPAWGPGYACALILGGYVFCVTLMSRLEERGAAKGRFTACAGGMAAAPVVGVAVIGLEPIAAAAAVALGLALLGHALASLRGLDRGKVMRNVRWGVLAIIGLDAMFVMAGAGWREGAAVLALAMPAVALLPVFRRV